MIVLIVQNVLYAADNSCAEWTNNIYESLCFYSVRLVINCLHGICVRRSVGRFTCYYFPGPPVGYVKIERQVIGIFS